ncbi:MAG: EAL domain-containing protein [Lachnospiraceae bacterium]|nr:EAL domain-containing protein [Lachnospiraceae bacterium]
MNIEVQICGLVLLLLIMSMSFSRRSIWLKTRKMYIFTLVSSIISISLDAASVVAIIRADGVYTMDIQVICKLYLLSLIITIFSTYLYISVDVSHEFKNYKLDLFLNCMFILTCGVLLYVLNIYYFDDNKGRIYTYGPAVIFTYCVCAFIVIMNYLVLVKYRNKMSKRRWLAGIHWMLIWIIAAYIQSIYNSLLIIGFASALGVLMLFIRLENPESYVDKITGYFNAQALYDYLNQAYQTEKEFYLISVTINNSHFLTKRFKNEDLNNLLRKLANSIGSVKGAALYRYREWDYCLVFENEKLFERAKEKIYPYFTNDWKVLDEYVNIDFCVIEMRDYTIADAGDEMVEMLRSFEKIHRSDTELVHILDSNYAKSFKKVKEIESTILDAIKKDKIEVFYQPIYSTEKNKIVSAEALVRIVNEDGSIITPGDFIPVAEENGMILDIGRIVFTKACKFISEYNIQRYGIEYLEINLSAVQCQRWELASEYIDIMKREGVDPTMINLEITESAATHSTDALLYNMNELIKVGVNFSLDDFGTGYSNLDYIFDLPIKIVKFDKKMTQAYFSDNRKHSIMKSVVTMMKDIELEIVAEGVEEIEQLKELGSLSVDFIQGYYFSKPIPYDKFLELLKSFETKGVLD